MRVDQAPGETTPLSTASFAAWVCPHWADMDRLALRLVGGSAAEDVVQEALAAAWRSRHRFDSRRGNPRAWLLAIVTNKARDHWQRTVEPAALVDDIAGNAPSSDATVDLSLALQQLTERRRVAVALYYYLQLTIDECAVVMDCSAGTVKSTLSDARAQLRHLLGEEYR